MVKAVGGRAANRLFSDRPERFDATEAHRIGLLTQIAVAGQLQEAADRLSKDLLANAPTALAAAKALVPSRRLAD